LQAAVRELSLSSPCSEDQILSAEASLRQRIPDPIRQVYLETNGFRGPTAAQFLWPIDDTQNGLVEMNKFLREGDEFPRLVRNWFFFGGDGVGAKFAIDPGAPDTVIKWDAEWGEEFETIGKDPFEAWQREQRFYDEVDGQERLA
jgi:hypothetical protein